MKFIVSILIAVLIVPIFSVLPVFSVFAGVNLKNGNFYINYTDIMVKGGGDDLKIVRTYNSKATEVGWFGYGWGSIYETKVELSGDGSVIVIENGAGARTRFIPKGELDVDKGVAAIIAAMKEVSEMPLNIEEKLKSELKGDAEVRRRYEKKFKINPSVKAKTLYSSLRGKQLIKVEKDSYERVFENGKTQIFNKEGHLTSIKDNFGNETVISYRDGKVTSIKDSKAKQLFFEWDLDGFVKTISSGTLKSEYKYKDKNLIESKDADGNIYQLSYDRAHNLQAVKDSTKKEMLIEYSKKGHLVSKITDREGNTTSYKYESNPKNSNLHYWTTVIKKLPDGLIDQNKYEYEMKLRPDGSQYTYRLLTDIGGFITETTYSECCGLPLKIKEGNEETIFEYNSRGLLTKKASTTGEYIEIEYAKNQDKISKVVDKKGWTKYKYDVKGNLKEAEDHKGSAILLVYNLGGRIIKMLDYNKKENRQNALSFKYNAVGKPTEIDLEKVGKISVSYNNFGEIEKVESKSDKKIAMQVTQVFQSLLKIVKPAGVKLSF